MITRKRLLRLCILCSLLLMGGAGWQAHRYSRDLQREVRGLFQQKTASPDWVYGEAVTLAAGMRLSPDLLESALLFMGYAAVTGKPDRPGRYRRESGAIAVYLRGLPEEPAAVPETTLRIAFDNGRIDALTLPKKKILSMRFA